MCRSAGLQKPPKLRANDQCPHFERLTFAREEFGNMHFSFAENIPFRCDADLVRALSFPLGPSSEDVISTPQLFLREEGLKSACLEALRSMRLRRTASEGSVPRRAVIIKDTEADHVVLRKWRLPPHVHCRLLVPTIARYRRFLNWTCLVLYRCVLRTF